MVIVKMCGNFPSTDGVDGASSNDELYCHNIHKTFSNFQYIKHIEKSIPRVQKKISFKALSVILLRRINVPDECNNFDGSNTTCDLKLYQTLQDYEATLNRQGSYHGKSSGRKRL